MKKAYLIVPLLLLAAFAVYFHSYSKEAASLAEVREKESAALKKQQDAERAAYQAQAAKEAREVIAAKNRAELVRQATIKAEEKEWEDLNKEYDDLTSERDDASIKSFDLTVELRGEEDRLATTKNRIEVLKNEKSFLDTYIPLSKANRDRIYAFLQKVDEAKKAAEAAAAKPARN